MATLGTFSELYWYLDLRALHHVTYDPSNLIVKYEHIGFQKVHIGNVSGLFIQHIGSNAVVCDVMPKQQFCL